MKCNFKNLLNSMYSLYSEEGKDKLDCVDFEFDADFDKDFFDWYCKLTTSNWEDKLRYLNGSYKYTEEEDQIVFKKGCLEKFVFSENKLYFRNKSEWFRKLPTDLLFASKITEIKNFKVHIPVLWIRRQELPLMYIWGKEKNINLLKKHIDNALYLIEYNTLEKVLKNRNSIARRYYLRYYYYMGDITLEQYKKHRTKTAKQMNNNSSLLLL